MDVELLGIEALRKYCCDALGAAAAEVRNQKQKPDAMIHCGSISLKSRLLAKISYR